MVFCGGDISTTIWKFSIFTIYNTKEEISIREKSQIEVIWEEEIAINTFSLNWF